MSMVFALVKNWLFTKQKAENKLEKEFMVFVKMNFIASINQ